MGLVRNKQITWKTILVVGLTVMIVAVVLLALQAPYGEDKKRIKNEFTYEGNLSEDKEGTYIWMKEQNEAVELNKNSDMVEQEIHVQQDGVYYLNAGYMPLTGNGQELELDILIDGQSIVDSTAIVTLNRTWGESGEFRYTGSGDEIRPTQIEKNLWIDEPLRISKKSRLAVVLSEGTHTVAIKMRSGSCLIQYLRMYQENLKSYDTYLSEHLDKEVVDTFYQQIEAETPYLKSSSELHASYDRSSPFSIPYHSTCLRYNVIGGEKWTDCGQWIEWQIDVPSDGFYQLGMRYRQNQNKGQNSLRALRIDGEIPFAEVATIAYGYDVDWQSDYFGSGAEPYLFYLTEGLHTIRMEVVLGDKDAVSKEMEETLSKINALYREIIIITGSNPDVYRDYDLESGIPEFKVKLETISNELNEYISYLESRYGKGCYSSRILKQMETQISDFIKRPYTVAKRLSVFKTNIQALAEWIFEFEKQALEIDYLYVTGQNQEIPRVEGNFLSKMGHEIRAFFGSFHHSYNDVASADTELSDEAITVWMGKGRDQANVVKRLIDTYFTPETGIDVNISLVEGALVKATLAGQGPDVNIFTTRGEAMNLAFRKAVVALDEMEGFTEMEKAFMDSAFVPYEYEDHIFAVPETQEFYVMYVRTDIFEELGLSVPQTWQDLMALLPILHANNLAIGLPYADGYATMNNGMGTTNLFPTLLAQKGMSVYKETEDGVTTNLLTEESYESFKQWSDFYVQYNFDLYKDDFNRFRTGEMPIVISSYALYNNLIEVAPEITGQWIMTAIPGTEKADGSIDRSTSASGTCSIVLKNCKDKEAAWEFVEWWNSAEIQAMYAKEIEAELSTLGRHTPANVEAFKESLWKEEEKELLLEQWRNVVEVPEIPGGYYVTRNLDNAFRQVFYNGENPRDTLIYWMNLVNEELARKQMQLDARKEGNQ